MLHRLGVEHAAYAERGDLGAIPVGGRDQPQRFRGGEAGTHRPPALTRLQVQRGRRQATHGTRVLTATGRGSTLHMRWKPGTSCNLPHGTI